MRKDKGQALIEFVLILPILLLFLFAIIDIGRLFYEKIQLEDRVAMSLDVLRDQGNYEEALMVLNRGQKEEATLNTEHYPSYMVVKVESKFSFLTPGLAKVLGDSYRIKIERTIPYAVGEV
ncbi:MAG: hypothetical protein HFG40_04525 [Bacilli bacterium]|nr:hypothetical protein [Bacilli bacterium]